MQPVFFASGLMGGPPAALLGDDLLDEGVSGVDPIASAQSLSADIAGGSAGDGAGNGRAASLPVGGAADRAGTCCDWANAALLRTSASPKTIDFIAAIPFCLCSAKRLECVVDPSPSGFVRMAMGPDVSAPR
jgi:hypothetical protein